MKNKISIILVLIIIMVIPSLITLSIFSITHPTPSHKIVNNKLIDPDYKIELHNDSVYIESNDTIIKCVFEDLEETLEEDNL